MLLRQIDNVAGCVFSTEDCKSVVVIFGSYKAHVIKIKSR